MDNGGVDYLKGAFAEQKHYLGERFRELREDIQEIKEVNKRQDERLCQLEKRKWTDKLSSGFGGVMGGFLAVIGLKGFRF